MGKLKVAGWLADQEQRYRTVLYVVDTPVNNPWTQTCIRQVGILRNWFCSDLTKWWIYTHRLIVSWLLVLAMTPALANMNVYFFQ